MSHFVAQNEAQLVVVLTQEQHSRIDEDYCRSEKSKYGPNLIFKHNLKKNESYEIHKINYK